MHPLIAHEVAKARIADWHRQAERDRIARAARLASREHDRRFTPGHPATVFARRAFATVARGLRPRPQPGQAPKATS
jgi:hypothetical protein